MTEEFTPIQPPVEPLPVQQPKKSNKTVWIIVIVAVVLLCCCCIIGGVLAWKPLVDWLQMQGVVSY